jgi:Ca-activated chloride channel family protein
LTAAVVTAPARVDAGAVFSVGWTGPDNRGDYLTIVRLDAPGNALGNYQESKLGKSLELTAPIEPGAHEVRYVTGQTHTILGRAPIEVAPTTATLDGPAEVVLGAPFSIAWMGPNNKSDYVTIVPKDAPDEVYGSYVDADKGSPETLTAPTEAGEGELRYVAGQGKKVLARRPIRIVLPEVSLAGPADAIAGSTIEVAWKGPNNSGDYITVVPEATPDGQYGNYTVTSSGSPLSLLTPIMAGSAELRYMTGQGNKVLARRPISIRAAPISLVAPPECKPDIDVSITWTGPNNPGDYITVVAASTPDGQYGAYTLTNSGSPLIVKSPKEPGDGEVRYMSGQGGKVLARIPIKIVQ